jgi:PAS domain S-box-containing protein
MAGTRSSGIHLTPDTRRISGAAAHPARNPDDAITSVSVTPSTDALLFEIREAQSMYISGAEPHDVYRRLIQILISLTGSTTGFLDQVRTDENGSMTSETLVNAGLVWPDSLLQFRQQDSEPQRGHTRFTAVIRDHSTSTGHPAPPHDQAILLPLVFGGEFVGIVGLAGQPGGYDIRVAAALEPFTATCAAIMRAIHRDRMEQVHAEEGRRQEETLRALIGNIPGAVYRCEVQNPWKMELMTGPIHAITGYPPSVFLAAPQKMYAEIVHPDDLKQLERAVAEGVRTHRPYQQEYRVIHADGSVRWVFERGCAYYDLAGNPAYLDGVIFDITDRKLAVDALIQSEEKVHSILRAAPTGIGVVANRIFRDVNTRMCELTRYTREELLGNSARMLYETDEEFQRVGTVKYAGIAATGTGTVETRWVRKDGTVVDVLLGSTPLNPQDLDKGVVFTALDITERKRAEAQVKASLREKEVLLKEIHHRVKNNLQVISSLLNIQMTGIKDPNTRELFRDSQNRVRSMALVHERLYRSATLAEVDFGEYTRAVTSHLVTSYAHPGITCTVEADNIRLGVDLAIPCGLILNEIVSNALKHAFTGRERGSVRVAIHMEGPGGVTMAIDDDGIGDPRGDSWSAATSMGTMIISSLTTQVGGTVLMSVDEGTHYRIIVPHSL